MGRKIKAIVSVTITICIMILSSSFVNAAVKVPENVRVGLYYGQTAVGVFTVSASKGLQLGFYKENAFTAVFEEPAEDMVTIRRDSYYVNNNNKLTAYTPGSGAAPQGDKIGPFHVQIGGDYNDLKALNGQLEKLKQKGIAAYPVYADAWKIWTGFYIDAKIAQTDIDNNINKKLGTGDYKVIEPAANRITAVSAKNDTLFMFGSDTARFQVHPKAENKPYIFKLNGSETELYRGDLEVRRFTGSDMTLINILPLEQYLYGVVPNELEASSPIEALKAQAVAARTYALNNISTGKHKQWNFDVCPTIDCQVYKGYAKEAEAANQAVYETAGKVVTYDGKPASVFYFSSSGGRTEDSVNVWGGDLPYLKSVEDKYESGKSWRYNWEYSITAERIKEVMLGRKYDLGNILSMEVTKTSDAGRAIELIITGTKDKRVYTKSNTRAVFSDLGSQWYTITSDSDVFFKGKDTEPVKKQLGSVKVVSSSGVKTLKSASNKISLIGASGQKKVVPLTPTIYKFAGKGWGHAVGMSQEGAKGMAKAGFKYDQILMHYFQGTKVE